jgi:hypothetical protein
MKKYLRLVEKYKLTPNFWCSEEYFKLSKWDEYFIDGWVFIVDPGWGVVLPPIHETKGLADPPIRKFWSDLVNSAPMEGWTSEFLDNEFIYDPKDFRPEEMTGKKWSVFRKNSRKFRDRTEGEIAYSPAPLYIVQFGNKRLEKEIEEVTCRWLQFMDDKRKIEDADVMLRYLSEGGNRRILYDNEKGNVYGINVFDSNFRYINFRYCICGKENFVSEYLRLLFYLTVGLQIPDKPVNDGGNLGSVELLKFKQKLNPISVREVHTWRKLSAKNVK